ncbi:MAG: DUF2000 domain-containing protein [Ethanoligenens sp.]
MEQPESKCVLVMDENLPVGVLANAAAILGITLGKENPACVGEDVIDASACIHKGIITTPVPILKENTKALKALRERLYTDEFQDLTVIDFSDVAQGCQTYEDYIQKVGQTKEESHTYLGVAIFGAKKKVNKLTGSLPLYR